ncbi:MAG: TlyA family RNA methyltransferase [Ilumatobacteraceae bacterium]|jgi:23S rRNA (cytidine1920-2'-O)/16S rRNA (cytidine1409-2'-O)-methyltransferase
MKRLKLERVLVERGFAVDVDEARRLIERDVVLVNGSIASNPERLVAGADQLLIVQPTRFVSRGGEKLEHALDAFDLDPRGMIAVDLGSSTGGFTDCLLQHGCAQVYAVDVGENLLHERIAGDGRVLVLAGVNVKDVERLPAHVADIVVVDLSFISAVSALPAIGAVTRDEAEIVVLVKPQFEADRSEADRFGGVIDDPTIRMRTVHEVTAAFVQAGLEHRGVVESPIRGHKGNVEYLSWFHKGPRTTP